MSGRAVLATGATGFIAQHVIDKLLERKYSVIGTTRSDEKSSILLKNFKGKYPDANLSFETVPDIAAHNAFDEVFEKHPEIKYVIHTASPVNRGSGKPFEEAFLKPALDGTLNILHGIKKYAPQVTNVVITSSTAAVRNPAIASPSTVYTNESWNPIKWEDVKTEVDAYAASKTYAERAARKFYEDEKPNFKLATVNPPYVLGPQVFDSSLGKVLNFSNQLLSRVFEIDTATTEPQGNYPALAIHVRDVAEFHILPLENKELESEREFIVGAPIIEQKILNILNDNFPELRGKIAVGDYDSANKLIDELCAKYDISSTVKKASNYKFLSVADAIVDTYSQYLLKYGLP